MLRQIIFVLAIILIWKCRPSLQDQSNLQTSIYKIISTKKATVGISVLDQNGKELVAIHETKHFPLQSVFKAHISLAVLAEVDKGRWTLDQMVEVSKSKLLPQLWSPLREANPNGGKFSLRRLIQYAIVESDNVACDILLDHIGGPEMVEKYFKANQVHDISIKWNEETMQSKWENMFQNWTTPKAACETLSMFYKNEGNLLSKQSHHFFWQTMKETTTGPNRLKGLLPPGTIVAHKTGSSGSNNERLSAATNDIGIVFLPDGRYFYISVFVANSRENADVNEKIIADIAKETYDYILSSEK